MKGWGEGVRQEAGGRAGGSLAALPHPKLERNVDSAEPPVLYQEGAGDGIGKGGVRVIEELAAAKGERHLRRWGIKKKIANCQSVFWGQWARRARAARFTTQHPPLPLAVHAVVLTMAAPAPAIKSIRVDASAEGCSGMYWRTKTEMNASTPTSGAAPDDWPRNGTVLKGSWLTLPNGERWVQFTNGFFLPEKQKGFTILFEEAE